MNLETVVPLLADFDKPVVIGVIVALAIWALIEYLPARFLPIKSGDRPKVILGLALVAGLVVAPVFGFSPEETRLAFTTILLATGFDVAVRAVAPGIKKPKTAVRG
ncbi:MAG: hypothetical protein RLY93_12420 [Sumerlaeia bacterium]